MVWKPRAGVRKREVGRLQAGDPAAGAAGLGADVKGLLVCPRLPKFSSLWQVVFQVYLQIKLSKPCCHPVD